jgi:AraC-type DNA-binding domain-containing proteins
MMMYIKNMVCNRCIAAVQQLLDKLQLHATHIALGEVELQEKKLSKQQTEQLSNELRAIGFEMIDDKKSQTIAQIKNLVVELVHYKEPIATKYSAYLSEKLQHDYTYLSKLFSEVEGITIEHYIIKQKIERAKELLVYDELSLSEIADQLGYSSVAHLSAQFKKITGLTPTFFKHNGRHGRTPLDKVG